MFSLALRRIAFAAVLLLSVGSAGAQNTTSAPSAIGKPVVLEGRLEVRIEDYADGHSRLRHFLETAQGRVELTFAGTPPQLPNGTRVRVRGQAQGVVVAVDGAGGIATLATALATSTVGQQSIAVLLVNFQDDTSQLASVADAQHLVFDDISNHYRESSFGQTWFTGQAFGWYTIAMSKTTCDPTRLASLADQQAATAGVDFSLFERRVYVFPTNACTWLGQGDVGGFNTQAWINGVMTLQVVGHELGHNYGLRHAHALDCDTGVFGDHCTPLGYGDAADLMGNGRPGQFNAFEKERLSWMNDSSAQRITIASTSGRYFIQPYSSDTTGPKALKIPIGSGQNGRTDWYYVEYRQPIGGDGVLADVGNLTAGVIVRTATDGEEDSSFQLDMSPGTSTNSFDEMADGALAVGQSHFDDVAGVTLTLVSTSNSGATVDVLFQPVCSRAAPTVSLSGGAAVSAGATVGYSLKVTNRDSSACAATTFNLASSVPAGWTGMLGAATMTLAPGATASVALDVTSDATAATGNYGIGAAASSPVSALHTANASATYTVAPPPCTRLAPDVALAGGGTDVAAGTTVGYTLTVVNRDTSTCGATTFNLARSVPTGWTGTLGATSVTLAPGATASTVLNVSSNATAAAGGYGIGAAAGSPVGTVHTANASAIYVVAPPPCTRAAPTVSLSAGAAVVAGSTVGYALKVINRDSVGCPATTFDLARAVPTGWIGTLGVTQLALAPGATGNTLLNVTSPAISAAGSYGIGAGVSSPVGASHTASASSTYIVATSLAIADAAVVEGNSGMAMANFVVSLAQPTAVPVTFDIATQNGTALAGSDYAATSIARVAIPAGTTSKTVSVPVIGDTAIEGDETFQVIVRNVVGATLRDGTGIGTLRNDDTTLTIADVATVEGNAGAKSAVFTVKLSNVSASPVTFNISTANSTALAGSDYVARSLGAQRIPAGSTSYTFAVSIAGDTTVEANETFLVNVSSVGGASVADGQAVGTIRNDDAVLGIADASITEGQSGTKMLAFNVKLSAASAAPVTFNLATANKTAAAGTDYVALALTGQSIPAGTTTKAFAVTIKGDTLKEGNETFVVNIGNVAGATVGDAQALGTITNDD